MARSERPGPAFIALRAATLGVDDLSRQALRTWVADSVDHRGQLHDERPEPSDEATRTMAAGIITLSDAERQAYRAWLMRWTDFSGRIITPAEHQRRLDAIQTESTPPPRGTKR